jgi:hypothetical protein
MRTKQQVIVATLAASTVALAGAGAAVATTSASSSHTLKLTSKTTSMSQFGPDFVSADKDLAGGHVVGADVLSGKVTYTKKTHSITGSIAIALKGGELYATVTGNPDTNALTGKLTGGAGKYKGVSGTISGKAVKGSNTEDQLVVKYH